MNGFRRFAIGAFPAQIKPGQKRYVQKPGNGIIAVRTVRGWADDAFIPRHAIDADIEKTADHAAKGKKHERPKFRRDARPDFRIKHRSHYFA